MKNPEVIRQNNNVRVVVCTAAELFDEGKDDKGKYVGGKWGGPYLRAPDIYFRILEKAGDKLVRLGDVAEVRFGIKTGANDFFHLEVLSHRPICPVCGEVHEDALTAEGERSYWEQGQQPPKNKLVAVKNGAGREGYLEAANLKPLVKSYGELVSNPNAIPTLRLFVYAGGEHSEDYLHYGERMGVSRRPSVSSRSPWWKLSPLTPPLAIVPAGVDQDYTFLPNSRGFLIDKRLYGLFNMEPTILALMNTALFKLSLEVLVRTGLGGGLADFTVYEYKQGLLLDPRLLPGDVDEVSDDLVADVLDLTAKERHELWLALEQLIEERVSRANS